MERKSEIHFSQEISRDMLQTDPKLQNLINLLKDNDGIGFELQFDKDGRAVLVETSRIEEFEDSDLDDPLYTNHYKLLGC